MASLTILLGKTGANIGGITLDAAIHEDHVHESDITENPVEEGVEVTDHVQLKPAQLTIEGVITDAPLGYSIIGNIQNLVRSVQSLFGASSRSVDAFNKLLDLRQKREPFTVVTGLKSYDNMIFSRLSVPREAATGNAIHFTAEMKQIRIVESKTISNPPRRGDVADRASKTKDNGQQVTKPTADDDPLKDGANQKPKSREGSKIYKITHPSG